MGKKLACALMFWAAPFAQAQSQEPADAAPESVPPPTEADEPASETAEVPPDATPSSPEVDEPAPDGPAPTWADTQAATVNMQPSPAPLLDDALKIGDGANQRSNRTKELMWYDRLSIGWL